MSDPNQSHQFLLGNKHTLYLFVLTLLALAVGMKYSVFTPVPSAPVLKMSITMAHLSLASLVCWPLYRRFYTCSLDKDRIYGFSSITPLLGAKRSCAWSRVAFVRYANYWGLEFYILQGQQGQNLLYLPCDVADYERFKSVCLCYGGRDHPLYLTLKQERRKNLLGFTTINSKPIHRRFTFAGQVRLSHRDAPLPRARVALLTGEKVLEKTIANENGEFYFDVVSCVGKHELRLETNGFQASKTFHLTGNLKHKLLLEASVKEARNAS